MYRQVVPPGLQLVAHPLRWRLLRELARSDRRVAELTAALEAPQNLVSYHLGRLRRAGLVTSHASAADGRSVYYAADLARCAQVFSAAAGELHPALRLAEPPGPRPRAARVLFLCTGNSARSQIAEALLRRLAAGTVEVASAGSAPKPLHPQAVRLMRERGLDVAGAEPKHLTVFAGARFDYVVSLCDRVREVCPDFPGATLVHWSIDDPAADGSHAAFRRVADELETRIRFLLHELG